MQNGSRFLSSAWCLPSQTLLDPEPSKRPSASALCRHPVLRKERADKRTAQLRLELNEEKFRTAMLER